MTDQPPIERIMLIDDDMGDQMIYKRIIKRSGLAAEVVGFNMAQDAIDYLKDPTSPEISLILLDIRMPIMSGFEFLEAAEPHFPDGDTIPVIMMLTTSMSPQDRETAEKFDRVRSYLTKPLKAEDLDEAVKVLASARKALRA